MVSLVKEEEASSRPSKPNSDHPASLRAILLIGLTICASGCFVLENPGTSLIYLHDRFQWLLQQLENMGMKVLGQDDGQEVAVGLS